MCGKRACACAASASPCTPGKRPRSPLKDAQLLFGTSESSDDAAVDNVRAQKRYLSEVGVTQTRILLSAQHCTALKPGDHEWVGCLHVTVSSKANLATWQVALLHKYLRRKLTLRQEQGLQLNPVSVAGNGCGLEQAQHEAGGRCGQPILAARHGHGRGLLRRRGIADRLRELQHLRHAQPALAQAQRATRRALRWVPILAKQSRLLTTYSSNSARVAYVSLHVQDCATTPSCLVWARCLVMTLCRASRTGTLP